MRMHRGLVYAALCLVLLAMFVHYGGVHQDRDEYATATELETAYAAHVGEAFYDWATVREVRSDTMLVEARGVTLEVTGTVPDADPGDVVQVYGTLAPEYRLHADRIVLSDGPNLLALYALSAFAAFLAIGNLLRFWTLDRSAGIITRREGSREHQ